MGSGLAKLRSFFTPKADLLGVVLFTLFALYVGTNAFSPIRFDRERIDVWAGDGQVRIHGLYHYRNRFSLPSSYSMGLPFPTDDLHGSPSDYSVSECSEDGTITKEISAHKYHGNVVFRLWFKPSQEKWIRIDYTQPILVSNARYILMTTQKWHQPLEGGEYFLHLKQGNELVTSNYAMQASAEGGSQTYSFTKTNFLPEEDWIFSWKSPEPLMASKQGRK